MTSTSRITPQQARNLHVAAQGLQVQWLLETHAHADHLSAAPWLKRQLPGAKLGIGAGIAALVKKLKGNELVLIPILMFIFSIGGTTYGMCEETVPFYLLLADWLSQLWPRWLLLLGVALIAVSLWMQRGLWGLGETVWNRLQGHRKRPARCARQRCRP